MLRRLSKYELGIFMPHMHNEHTGAFQRLPDKTIQVESGLEVSFQPTEQIATQAERFVPVGWLWRAGGSKPAAVCEMVSSHPERFGKHKMGKGD
jgi:hypothetical protein